MELMKLFAYTDEKFTQQHLGKLVLPVNPEALKFEKGIAYREDQQQGTTNSTNTFDRYKPQTLAFGFFIDCTGAVEGTLEGDRVEDKIQDLENHLYDYNSEGHRPSYIVLAYGELVFKCQLTSMQTEYMLFNNMGIPLRAKVDLAFSGFLGSEEDKRKYSKLSPDMSRAVVLREGETLAELCHRFYGNSLLVTKVARYNGLNGFRDIAAGTEILFPPLKKD